MRKKVAVALCFFKRKCVVQVIEQIRKYAPEIIYLIADGGRNKEEHEQCLAIRHMVEKAINWPCEIKKVYSDKNLGCRIGIPRGLNIAFQNEERLIILEDDCVPAETFFTFCEEMLERYKDNTNIMTVSGTNFLTGKKYFGDSDYTFSGYVQIWGWATWKRAWIQYDSEMKLWHEKRNNVLQHMNFNRYQSRYWEQIFEQVYNKTCSCDPWDYQWFFMSLLNQALDIIPKNNLITNIGFGEEATHTQDTKSKVAYAPREEIIFPLKHPSLIKRNTKFDKAHGKIVFYPNSNVLLRTLRKLKRIIKRIISSLVN